MQTMLATIPITMQSLQSLNREIAPWGQCRCRCPVTTRTPVARAAAGSEPVSAIDQPQQPPPAPEQQQQQQKAGRLLKLTRRHRGLSFFKWEQKLCRQLMELQQEQALLAGSDDDDNWYFSFFDAPDGHLPVLQDKSYQAAWAKAFGCDSGRRLFEGKVVLDVGCGLGTLAMMAAKAGAKHVYAVDASPGAAELARRVIAANGLSGQITVIQGRAERVQLPVRPGSVDVILSDWMGSMLLHDGLLPAVLRARDRWLAPGGIILPDSASLHAIAIDDRQYLSDQSSLWSSQQLGPGGLDLRPALAAVIKHPRVDTTSRKAQLVTDSQRLLQLDLYTATLQDMTFQSPFALTAQRDERVSGLLTYFDVTFSARGMLQPPQGVTFSTSPAAPDTSWLQLLFSFPRAIKMQQGQQLLGSFSVAPVGLPIGRMLDVDVEVEFGGSKARVAYQLKR